MNRRFIAAAALAVTLVTAGCTTGHDAVDQANASGMDVTVGTKTFAPGARMDAPAVTGTLLDGGSFDMAAQRGHVVVVNVWGSWCGTCRIEAADLATVNNAMAAKGVRFVGIDLRDSKDGANDYIASHHITFPSIFDPAGRTLLQFTDVPPQAVPSTVVIDATGKIASVHYGVVTRAELTDMIAKATS
jgi:peroxiredoxin